jgi:hypothetical protein
MEGRVDTASSQDERYLRGLTAHQMFNSVRKYVNVKFASHLGRPARLLRVQLHMLASIIKVSKFNSILSASHVRINVNEKLWRIIAVHSYNGIGKLIS